MAFDFSAGLSEAGKAVATTAGAYTLEAQKGTLEEQKVKLADELASQREEKQRGFLASESALGRGSAEKIANLQTAAHLGAASIGAGATVAAAKMRTDVEREALTPAEVRTAQWFAKASPAEKEAFQTALLTKAGMPAWAVGGGGTAETTPPTPVQLSGGGMPSPTGAPGSVSGEAPAGAPKPTAPPRDIKATPSGFNEDALQNLPPEAAAQVKAMVEGRTAPPSSFAASKPYWQAMLAAANKYDPTFDQATWASRVATRKDFTAGKAAMAVTAMNTALGHADRLSEKLEALNNFGSVGTPLNTPLNAIGSAFGDDRQTRAKEVIDALASEARKVFAGTGGGNLTELLEWQKNFPLNGSPAQQKGAIQEFVGLLDSRLAALSDQYNRGMGRTAEPLMLLEPKARAIFEKLTGEKPENSTGYQTGKSGAGSTGAEPATALPPVDKRAIGKTYPTPRGPAIWMGNGWALVPQDQK